MTESPFSKNARVLYFGWSREPIQETQLEKLKSAKATVAGLPVINSQNMILGNFLKGSAGNLPSYESFASTFSGNGNPQNALNKHLDPAGKGDSVLDDLPPPHIIPDVSRVACNPVQFELYIGNCPCCYYFDWSKSSNLEYVSGGKDRFYTVRAKNGAYGSGWIRCVVTDGKTTIIDIQEEFTVEGFNVTLSPNIDILRCAPITFTARTPYGCPANFIWNNCNNLIPLSCNNGSKYTVKAKAGASGYSCVTVSASNSYGDTDIYCETFYTNTSLPVISSIDSDNNVERDTINYVRATVSNSTKLHWEIFGGEIASRQGTTSLRFKTNCDAMYVKVTLTATNSCGSVSKTRYIHVIGGLEIVTD